MIKKKKGRMMKNWEMEKRKRRREVEKRNILRNKAKGLPDQTSRKGNTTCDV